MGIVYRCDVQSKLSKKETPIERIYREVTGRKMSAGIKRVLLPKGKRPKAH